MIGIAVITHNRLDYTKQCIESLIETTDVPHRILVADNASTDGTREYLQGLAEQGVIHGALLLDDNMYPGYATNRAWEALLTHLIPDAQFLMRSDNDMLYRKGWDIEAMKAFEAMPFLGQLGLMNQEQCFPEGQNKIKPHEEGGYTVNVHWTNIGGTNIIRRELWEMGLRYDERKWHAEKDANGNPMPTPQEDVLLSINVQRMGYFFANLIPHLCVELSYGNTADYFDYYERTFAERGHGKPDLAKDGVVLEEGDAWRLREQGLAR